MSRKVMRSIYSFFLLLVPLFLLSHAAIAQQFIPVSTFTINGLNSKVASAGLPERFSIGLVAKLSNAQTAYVRGNTWAAIGLLRAFTNEVQAQCGKLIEPSLTSQFVSEANGIILALQNGYNLGGSTVGSDGAILEVTDPNSPAIGTRLTIPPNALSQPIEISMSTPDHKPTNSVLTFAGSGIALKPEGLVFTEPATLVLPYPDADNNSILDGTDFPVEFLHVGVQDSEGQITFAPSKLNTASHTQILQIGHFSFYWIVAWRWPGDSTITYKFVWPMSGVSIAPGYDLNALKEGVRQAIRDWECTMIRAGIIFEEVTPDQPASIQFGFFSSWYPFVLNGTVYRQDASGVGFEQGEIFYFEYPRQAAWFHGNASPDTSGAEFEVRFNADFDYPFGGPKLAWTIDSNGNPSAVSIHAVAVHAIGHVLGLNDWFGPSGEITQPPIMASLADLLSPEICPFVQDNIALQTLYDLPLMVQSSCPHAGITVSPVSFDFGTVAMGSTSEKWFTIRNSGSGTLQIYSFSHGEDFSLDLSALRSILRPGESTSFRVTFAPNAVGLRKTTIQVDTNAASGPTLLNVSGTGLFACLLFEEDFNDNSLDTSKWEPEASFYGSHFTETNHHLEFTTIAPPPPAHSNEAYIRPKIRVGYSNDFSVVIDLTNAAPPNLHRGTALLLELHSSLNWTDYLRFASTHHMTGLTTLSTVLVHNHLNVAGNQVGTQVLTDQVRLRIDYNARTKVLTTYYDTNPADADQWFPLEAFGIDGDDGPNGNADWGMGANDGFSVDLHAYATFDNVENYTAVQPDQMYADNLFVSGCAIPVSTNLKISTNPGCTSNSCSGLVVRENQKLLGLSIPKTLFGRISLCLGDALPVTGGQRSSETRQT